MTQRLTSGWTFLAGALLSVAFAVSVLAQSTEWKEYASEKGKFSVLLPGGPETGYRFGPAASGAVMSYVTNYQKDAKAWSVVYFDLPSIPPDADAVKKLFERERDSYTPKPSGEKSLTLNGHPALEFKTLIDDRDRVQIVRIILVKQRVFELWVVTQARRAASEDVTRFFDSFKPAPLAAARLWVFRPTELSGRPVRVEGRLIFKFTPQ
jgi:hypothetical protein